MVRRLKRKFDFKSGIFIFMFFNLIFTLPSIIAWRQPIIILTGVGLSMMMLSTVYMLDLLLSLYKQNSLKKIMMLKEFRYCILLVVIGFFIISAGIILDAIL